MNIVSPTVCTLSPCRYKHIEFWWMCGCVCRETGLSKCYDQFGTRMLFSMQFLSYRAEIMMHMKVCVYRGDFTELFVHLFKCSSVTGH